MKSRKHFLLLISIIFFAQNSYSQYLIEGRIENLESNPNYIAYLSIVENWDDFRNINKESIIKYSQIDSLGYFKFSGNEFSNEKGFYRIHFAPKNNSTLILGFPKNYVNFILSNKDSISLDLKSKTFASIVNVSSSINENEKLKELSSKIDNYKVQIFQSSIENQESSIIETNSDSLDIYNSNNNTFNNNQLNLLKEKQKQYLLSQIKLSNKPLLNMYSVYYANLDYTEYPDIYKELSKNLKNTEYKESYHTSLNQFISLNSHEEKSKKISYLYVLLICISIICGALIVYLIILKQKNKPSHKNLNNQTSALTSKESQIYNLILQHKTNKEIASELFISSSTVKTHINNIYRKLGIKSRKELITSQKQ